MPTPAGSRNYGEPGGDFGGITVIPGRRDHETLPARIVKPIRNSCKEIFAIEIAVAKSGVRIADWMPSIMDLGPNPDISVFQGAPAAVPVLIELLREEADTGRAVLVEGSHPFWPGWPPGMGSASLLPASNKRNRIPEAFPPFWDDTKC
jgi:hypothetical protein